MTCRTCEDRGWTTGVPDAMLVGSTGIGDDTGVRDWIVPCECSPARTPHDLAQMAKAAGANVGWSLTTFGTRFVPWPFRRKMSQMDDVSAWTEDEPDDAEEIWMHITDLTDLPPDLR